MSGGQDWAQTMIESTFIPICDVCGMKPTWKIVRQLDNELGVALWLCDAHMMEHLNADLHAEEVITPIGANQ